VPVAAQRAGRSILVNDAAAETAWHRRTAVDARVWSADPKADLDRQKGLPGARARRRGLSDAALGTARRRVSYKAGCPIASSAQLGPPASVEPTVRPGLARQLAVKRERDAAPRLPNNPETGCKSRDHQRSLTYNGALLFITVTVRLADIIAVLDGAYPPKLAQSWDSVGLVCGDPADVVESVTVAVDATAAVVDDVPDRGLLLAHHPLLLRGVDTVAANTPKGALLHRLIRGGRALFTAHTNADSAAPGVSDALAQALGLTVTEVLDPAPGADVDKWVFYVPPAHAEAVRAAVFAAGAGRIGDYSCCSWSVTGTGQFLPREGAAPAVGTIGEIERLAEDRVEAIAPRRSRAGVLTAMRSAHPYEEPAFDVVPLAPMPEGTGLGRIAELAEPESLREFVARVGARLPATVWGVRASGDPDLTVSRVALCGGAGDSLLDMVARAGVQAYVTADLRHHPADEHGRGCDVALVDVAHWASEHPWCGQAAALLRTHFGDDLPVRVSTIRTDPWNLHAHREKSE